MRIGLVLFVVLMMATVLSGCGSLAKECPPQYRDQLAH